MNALPSAVFLDRDGTIIRDAHYLSDPSDVVLIEGAAEAIARMNAALVPVVVITNQSGIGRGYFTLEQHESVSRRVMEALAGKGARIDASYFCPHPPDDHCDCRKPGLLLFRKAADDHGIDLSKALYAGDRRRDIEPGILLGGSAVLVPSPETPEADIEFAELHARVAPSLATAVDWYLCTN
ncbi:MAG: D-glycero-alpha-D-manno-heptose-1,7-bisphosphate 7-phosphatase [Gemmatimonadaceae bacterium]